MRAALNTDKEIWRQRADDYYADSIHVTQADGIGLDVGGHVIVAQIKRWHELGEKFMCVNPKLPKWKYHLAMWLLK
jgi:hypothetical protein